MDHEAIDFSALDPSRDELRWTRSIAGIVESALAERRRRLSVRQQLLGWARPALSIAAALCLAVWTAGYFSYSTRQAVALSPVAIAITTWAANHQVPEPSELLGVLRSNP
ncbi:MAG: hypothetical protein ABSB49_11105 [Polyangia bacterium]|jgi:hypothetical protein